MRFGKFSFNVMEYSCKVYISVSRQYNKLHSNRCYYHIIYLLLFGESFLQDNRLCVVQAKEKFNLKEIQQAWIEPSNVWKQNNAINFPCSDKKSFNPEMFMLLIVNHFSNNGLVIHTYNMMGNDLCFIDFCIDFLSTPYP